jgi:hypothetical protein
LAGTRVKIIDGTRIKEQSIGRSHSLTLIVCVGLLSTWQRDRYNRTACSSSVPDGAGQGCRRVITHPTAGHATTSAYLEYLRSQQLPRSRLQTVRAQGARRPPGELLPGCALARVARKRWQPSARIRAFPRTRSCFTAQNPTHIPEPAADPCRSPNCSARTSRWNGRLPGCRQVLPSASRPPAAREARLLELNRELSRPRGCRAWLVVGHRVRTGSGR